MSNKTIEVSLWSDAPKSWGVLTVKGAGAGTWTGKVRWFPKSLCSFDEKTNKLTAPEWLINKNNEAKI